MAHIPYTYELSLEADTDLEDIFDYTDAQFGIDQAVRYLNSIDEVLHSLCNNPRLGRKRNEIRNGLRSISHQSHTIFYRVSERHIRVVRILHASRDTIRFIPPQE